MCTRCRPTQRPKLARLIEALHRLGGDPAVAEKHASIIFARLIAVVAPARGFDIGGNDEAGFYAHPRTQTTGLERELRDLGGKARKAACGKLGLTAWMAAWAVLPQRTMHLLWRPKVMRTAQGHTIDRSRIAGSFSAPGFTRSRLSRKWSCQPSKPRSSGSRQHPARGGDSARHLRRSSLALGREPRQWNVARGSPLPARHGCRDRASPGGVARRRRLRAAVVVYWASYRDRQPR